MVLKTFWSCCVPSTDDGWARVATCDLSENFQFCGSEGWIGEFILNVQISSIVNWYVMLARVFQNFDVVWSFCLSHLCLCSVWVSWVSKGLLVELLNWIKRSRKLSNKTTYNICKTSCARGIGLIIHNVDNPIWQMIELNPVQIISRTESS